MKEKIYRTERKNNKTEVDKEDFYQQLPILTHHRDPFALLNP